jgi:hypothetical protein
MSFQVKGNWENGRGEIGIAATIEEAVVMCDAKGCTLAWIFNETRDCLYQVKKGMVLENGVVIYTKQRDLQPIFDIIQPLHEKLYEAEEKIVLKIYQIKKLMDLDAKQTKAPLSLSCLLAAAPVFSHDLVFENNEESLKISLDILQSKLQKAQYLAGQLEEWVIDWVDQTCYKDCLADL